MRSAFTDQRDVTVLRRSPVGLTPTRKAVAKFTQFFALFAPPTEMVVAVRGRYQRAIQANPRNARAAGHYAKLLHMCLGDMRKAEKYYVLARELDGNNNPVYITNYLNFLKVTPPPRTATYAPPPTHTHKHPHTNTHTHARARTHTRTLTHTQTHAHKHSGKHTGARAHTAPFRCRRRSLARKNTNCGRQRIR